VHHPDIHGVNAHSDSGASGGYAHVVLAQHHDLRCGRQVGRDGADQVPVHIRGCRGQVGGDHDALRAIYSQRARDACINRGFGRAVRANKKPITAVIGAKHDTRRRRASKRGKKTVVFEAGQLARIQYEAFAINQMKLHFGTAAQIDTAGERGAYAGACKRGGVGSGARLINAPPTKLLHQVRGPAVAVVVR